MVFAGGKMNDDWWNYQDNPKAIKRRNELVLSSIPTADLVAELSKRDGVIVPHPDLWFGTINNEIKCGKPPKILVVRE